MDQLNRTLEGIKARGSAGLFIDGRWTAGCGSQMLEVIAPHSEEVLLRYTEATPADIDVAVQAARNAFDTGPWPRLSPRQRSEALNTVASNLEKRLPELAEAWTGQVGAVLGFTRKASTQVPDLFRYYATLCETYAFEQERPRTYGGVARVLKEPSGVIAAITPWNAPMVLLCYKVAAGLAAGCTVVSKPSPETPLDAHILAECIQAADLPAGVFNLVPGGREVGDYLVRHAGIDKVSFTGSAAVGKHIARTCADRLARVNLELGGKSAALILEDARIEQILPSLVPYSMPITGQVCFSLTRVLVPRARQAEIVQAYVDAVKRVRVGNPFEEGVGMGPLTMARQRDRVEGYIQKGRAEGARIVLGGGRPAGLTRGFYVEPTVFVDVDPRMTIAREEIFGPVVSFIEYEDERDMIAKANATEYGLHGAVYTADADRGFDVARRIRSGSVAVNGMGVDIRVPFGGFKQSGVGREGGIEGLEGYLETKTVYLS